MPDIYLNSKCINYKIYKDIFGFKDYLIQLPDNLRVALTKFRCRNNKMPVEIGVRDNVPRQQRFGIYVKLGIPVMNFTICSFVNILLVTERNKFNHFTLNAFPQ